MKTRTWIEGTGTVAMLALATPAHASSPSGSCIGQQLLSFALAYGAEQGAAVSFEAQTRRP